MFHFIINDENKSALFSFQFILTMFGKVCYYAINHRRFIFNIMQTLNISVTAHQFNLVNQLTAEWGFANRSEFFRALLRALIKPGTLSTPIQFQTPPTKDIGKVMDGFRKTGKYNQKFLASLEKGLAKSTYFNS